MNFNFKRCGITIAYSLNRRGIFFGAFRFVFSFKNVRRERKKCVNKLTSLHNRCARPKDPNKDVKMSYGDMSNARDTQRCLPSSIN